MSPKGQISVHSSLVDASDVPGTGWKAVVYMCQEERVEEGKEERVEEGKEERVEEGKEES